MNLFASIINQAIPVSCFINLVIDNYGYHNKTHSEKLQYILHTFGSETETLSFDGIQPFKIGKSIK